MAGSVLTEGVTLKNVRLKGEMPWPRVFGHSLESPNLLEEFSEVHSAWPTAVGHQRLGPEGVGVMANGIHARSQGVTGDDGRGPGCLRPVLDVLLCQLSDARNHDDPWHHTEEGC